MLYWVIVDWHLDKVFRSKRKAKQENDIIFQKLFFKKVILSDWMCNKSYEEEKNLREEFKNKDIRSELKPYCWNKVIDDYQLFVEIFGWFIDCYVREIEVF